jgi:hypothetical protein
MPGGMYTGMHYDYTFLAQTASVNAKSGAVKLFLMWPPNENNLSLMRRRARAETSTGWEDGIFSDSDQFMVDFDKFTGLHIAFLRHHESLIMPEQTLHVVMTHGTAGIRPIVVLH